MIKHIDISPLFPDSKITICICQLRSPFPDEVYFEDNNQGGASKRLIWRKPNPFQREVKLRNLFTSLESIIIDKKVQIIILPEYSVEEEYFEFIKNFSSKNNVIVCAGFYNANELASVLRICIPFPEGIKEFDQYKISPSIYDAHFLQDNKGKEEEHYLFEWQVRGTKYFFAPFVCLDFNSRAIDLIKKEHAGLLIASMCTPSINASLGIADYFMRIPSGFFSMATALCNATDLTLDSGGEICGESTIVGPSNYFLPKIPFKKEGVLIASIDLANVIIKPTRLDDPKKINVVSPHSLLEIDRTGCAIELTSKEIPKETYSINPNVIIKHLGLNKYYAFYSTPEYYSLTRKLMENKKFPISAHGLFGKHDILFQGYDEGEAFFKLRLEHFLKEQFRELGNAARPAEYYLVTDVLKYRGIRLPENPRHGDILVTGIKDLIYKIESDKYYSSDDVNKVIVNSEKDSIILQTISKSDITPSDKMKSFEEFLVLLFPTFPADSEVRSSKEFRSKIIAKLLDHPNIRTIEFCQSGPIGDGEHKGSYILHVVGQLDDLRCIVIRNILEPLDGTGIKCGTRVIPHVEPICNNEHHSLLETSIANGEHRIVIFSIIERLIGRVDNPFLVKQLDHLTIERIVHLYSLFTLFLKTILKPDEKGHVTSDQYKNELSDFIYGISITINQKETYNLSLHKDMSYFCRDTFKDATTSLESTLDKYRNKIKLFLENQDESVKNQIHNELEGIKADSKGTTLLSVLNAKTTILGNLYELMYTWETKISKDRINLKLLSEDDFEIAKRLRHTITDRNSLDHSASLEKDQARFKKSASAVARSLLESCISILEFVNSVNPILSKQMD